MGKLIAFILLLAMPLLSEEKPRYKVGVCITAMEKYDTYAQALIESGRRYFCTDHDVTYFVFTCGKGVADAPDVKKISMTPLGWPYDILKRVHYYDDHRELFDEMDYVFAMAANMLFIEPVGDEVLADLVAVQHHAYLRKRGLYENKKTSTAYVDPKEGEYYFTNRFFGGSREQFLRLISTIRRQVDTDLAKNFIARMHDESYLNRYFIDHPPEKVLTPSYCYPINWQLDYPKKIITVNRNRNQR